MLFEGIVLGFRKLTTTSFWPLDSWPSQLIENSYPEIKTGSFLTLGPGFDLGRAEGHTVLLSAVPVAGLYG